MYFRSLLLVTRFRSESVKHKLSEPVFFVFEMMAYGGGGRSIAPPILHLVSSAPAALPAGRNPGTHLARGWVDLRDGLKVLKKKTIYFPCVELQIYWYI
jgi:hypothetical protein